MFVGRPGRRRGPLALLIVCLAGAFAAPEPASAFVWPNVPERIAKGLESNDPAERRNSAQEIASLPQALAKPLAVKALGDEDSEVRIAAAKVSAKLRIPGASDIVSAWLSDSDARLRLAACEVIRSSPTDRSVTALGRVLSDPSQDVRVAAAQAMGRSGSSDAVSLLLGHLDDNSPEVRAEVATSLGRLGDARAVLPLVGRAQDTAPEVRRRVARALGDLRDSRALSALVRSLSDANSDVRVESALALGRIGSDEATVSLAPHVQPSTGAAQGAAPSSETSLALRQAALRALGRIGSTRAIDLLIGALETDRPDAGRVPAREALVTVGKKATKAIVASLSTGPSARTATGLVDALAAIGDASTAPAIVRAMQRGTVPAPAALSALAKLEAEPALPSVLELIGDPSPQVRRAAIRAALVMIDPAKPDGRAVEPVSDALDDPSLDPEDRVALVELLGRTGSPRASEQLLTYVGSKSPSLRRASLRGLGSLSAGSASVDDKLAAALDDELGTVRMDAAIAISRVGTKELAPKLLERLLKSAEQDRAALGIALAGVMSRSSEPALAQAVSAAVSSAPTSARDALIEGLGRLTSDASIDELKKVSGGSVDDRRKVAEVAAAQGSKAASLVASLAADPDPGVRANAAWSLGAVGDAATAASLAKLATDPDVDVAGNALAALGRLAAREKNVALVEPTACAALSDTRPYVRANALSGLRLAGGRCDVPVLASLLSTDPSERVRIAAASLLHDIASAPAATPPLVAPPPAPAPAPSADPKAPAAKDAPLKPAVALDPVVAARKALDRCISEEPTFRVARQCESGESGVASSRTLPLTVFVVPEGAAGPVPRAPFALALPDGTLRLGVSDRRGVVFEPLTPDGEVELAVPAAQALGSL